MSQKRLFGLEKNEILLYLATHKYFCFDSQQ